MFGTGAGTGIGFWDCFLDWTGTMIVFWDGLKIRCNLDLELGLGLGLVFETRTGACD